MSVNPVQSWINATTPLFLEPGQTISTSAVNVSSINGFSYPTGTILTSNFTGPGAGVFPSTIVGNNNPISFGNVSTLSKGVYGVNLLLNYSQLSTGNQGIELIAGNLTQELFLANVSTSSVGGYTDFASVSGTIATTTGNIPLSVRYLAPTNQTAICYGIGGATTPNLSVQAIKLV